MAFDPQLDPNENVEHDIDLVISNKPQVRLVLTSHAAYWPGKKTFALSDPITTIKVDPDSIEEVFVGRKSSIGSIAAGGGMVIAGLAWTFIHYPEAYVVGFPQALILGGVGVGIFGGRRSVLSVKSADQHLHWVAPIAFGGSVKHDIAAMFTQIAEWCKKHSVKMRIGNAKSVGT
ncbi:hypothetical protein QQ054_31890 [Oscillatoria amoena NRMC-F 0135]|nr:hypothetical protein [Oscillatoria laete-virens]MDL5050605.1 hypothetical protein [Oscillatoria amoena NRMC-F 0135]MDL5055619.1 hypothetical protein [Oscillatoria laete-virens NRMC-F 0139]